MVSYHPARVFKKTFLNTSEIFAALPFYEKKSRVFVTIYKEGNAGGQSMEGSNKPKILIADDSEMNRSILQDMLEDEYEILEAENGKEAVAKL